MANGLVLIARIQMIRHVCAPVSYVDHQPCPYCCAEEARARMLAAQARAPQGSSGAAMLSMSACGSVDCSRFHSRFVRPRRVPSRLTLASASQSGTFGSARQPEPRANWHSAWTSSCFRSAVGVAGASCAALSRHSRGHSDDGASLGPARSNESPSSFTRPTSAVHSSQTDLSRQAVNATVLSKGEAELLRPLPPKVENRIVDFDIGPFANPRALENEAFYLPALHCETGDRSVFDRLMSELDFKDCWLDTGMKFSRQICIGDEELLARAPTYRAIVERVTKVFGVKAVRTLVNLYRDGTDWCNLHSDQYHQGGYPIDLTVGSTFGDPRRLIWVEKKNPRHKIEMPQLNGDVFAFSDAINTTWRHMIPQEGQECGPRISVIVWCNREKSSGHWMGSLGAFPHMLHQNPKQNGMDYEARPGHYPRRDRGKGDGKGSGKGRSKGTGKGRVPRTTSAESFEPSLPPLPDAELEEAVQQAQRALTLQGAQQVYAILRGIKLLENRTWAIPPGWHALHAGAQSINEERRQRTLEAWPEAPAEEDLPHRAIAGLFYVQEHRSPEDCQPNYIWARGPVCNVISRAVEFQRPIPCPGDRGLWDLGGLKQRIRKELLRSGSQVSVKHFDLTPALGA